MKIHPVGAELLRADRRTNTTKLTVALRNSANAPATLVITTGLFAPLQRRMTVSAAAVALPTVMICVSESRLPYNRQRRLPAVDRSPSAYRSDLGESAIE
jgi:predicted alpha/beta-hydrolase family hydrolase